MANPRTDRLAPGERFEDPRLSQAFHRLDRSTRQEIIRLEGKIPDVVNVNFYGAKGDADINPDRDDTEAIQRAIDAAEAAGGGTVYFPPGRYNLTEVIVDEMNVHLMGAQTSASILQVTGTGFNGVRVRDGRFSMSNLSIWAKSGDSPDSLLLFEVIDSSINQCQLNNLRFDGQGAANVVGIICQADKNVAGIGTLIANHVTIADCDKGLRLTTDNAASVSEFKIFSHYYNLLTVTGCTTALDINFVQNCQWSFLDVETNTNGVDFNECSHLLFTFPYVTSNTTADFVWGTNVNQIIAIGGVGIQGEFDRKEAMYLAESQLGIRYESDVGALSTLLSAGIKGHRFSAGVPWFRFQRASGKGFRFENSDGTEVFEVECQGADTDHARLTNFLEMDEHLGGSAPAAPADSKGRVYMRSAGGGKTELVVRFPTGAVQVLATEP